MIESNIEKEATVTVSALIPMRLAKIINEKALEQDLKFSTLAGSYILMGLEVERKKVSDNSNP